MSDMGDLQNLSTVFSDLGGYSTEPIPQQEPTCNAPPGLIAEEAETTYYEMIGNKIGLFFGKLHSPASAAAILRNTERGFKFLENLHLENFAFDNGIRPIKAHLRLFPQLLTEMEASELYRRAATGNTIPLRDEETSFILADCWPESVLVSPASDVSAREQQPSVSVVDWEFSRMGGGLNTDIAQLLARFNLLHCAAKCRRDSLREWELAAIGFGIMKSYRSISIEESSCWTKGCSSRDESSCADLVPDSIRTRMLRSAFITHGIEMMRCAMGKTWSCQADCCSNGMRESSKKHECRMIQAMVERAIWYFRHAREDERAFASSENLNVLQRAKRDGVWLLSLF